MTESDEPDSHNGRAESLPEVPRWIKVSGLAILIVAVVLVVVMLVVGGEHGPGLHTGAESATAIVASGAVALLEAR